jgi:hypothetical protein
MISRDRFEVILNAIANGTPITNARNRLEKIFSAIAENMGGGGGGGSAITREVIGTYDLSNIGQVPQASCVTTKSMSDYDAIEITFTGADGYAGVVKNVDFVNTIEYIADGGVMGILPLMGQGSVYSIYGKFDSDTTITLLNSHNGSLNIRQIVGIKYGG